MTSILSWCRSLTHTSTNPAACMQAELPGCLQHSPPAQLQRDLSALATTYANLRKGECSVRKQVLLDSSAVRQQGALQPAFSSLSPAGDAAYLFWSNVMQDASGLQLALEESSPGKWLVPLHDPMGSMQGHRNFARHTWSPTGLLGVQYRASADTAEHRLRLFDVQRRCWLQELCLLVREDCCGTHLCFSDCGNGVACLFVDASHSKGHITVGNAEAGSVHVIMVPGPTNMVWLPCSNNLLLWGDQGMAVCGIPSHALPSESAVQWQEPADRGQYAAPYAGNLAALPQGLSVAAVQWSPLRGSNINQPPGQVRVWLTLRSTAQPDFELLSHKDVLVPLPAGVLIINQAFFNHDFCSMVHASHKAVVVMFAYLPVTPCLGTWVWALDSHDSLGSLLFCRLPLSKPSLSPDGSFLAGINGNRVCVYDIGVGLVAELQPSQYLSGPAEHLNRAMSPHSVVWGGSLGVELLILASRSGKRGHKDIVFSIVHA